MGHIIAMRMTSKSFLKYVPFSCYLANSHRCDIVVRQVHYIKYTYLRDVIDIITCVRLLFSLLCMFLFLNM